MEELNKVLQCYATIKSVHVIYLVIGLLSLVINLLRADCNLISEIECLCVIYLMLNLLSGYC